MSFASMGIVINEVECIIDVWNNLKCMPCQLFEWQIGLCNQIKELYTMYKASTFRVCLFGGEIELMENFGEKIGMKTFLECVWLGGKEEK